MNKFLEDEKKYAYLDGKHIGMEPKSFHKVAGFLTLKAFLSNHPDKDVLLPEFLRGMSEGENHGRY
jgi:hypothetical protein